MRKSLRILNVEDSDPDSTLLTRHLEVAAFDLYVERVETAEAMKAALLAREWDLILCDYSMPRFSALAALTILRASNLDVPFIIISGTVGEEIAVKALLSGANDYIPKGNLTRLIPAIERELKQAESRRDKRKAEEALTASEAELRALFAGMTDVIFVLGADGDFRKIAPTKQDFLYKPSQDLIGKRLQEVFPSEQADLFLKHMRQALDQGRMHSVEYALQIDGAEVWFDGSVSPLSHDSVLWIGRDITQRKRVENELRLSEERFSGAFEMAPIGVALVLPDGRFLKVNRAVSGLLGYSQTELLDLTFQDITHADDLEKDLRNVNLLLAREISHYQMEKRYIHKRGHTIFVHLHVSLVRSENGDPTYFISQIQDITDRKADEHQLNLHSLILNSIGQAVIVTDSTGLITYWNDFAENMYGWKSSDVLGRNIVEVTPSSATRLQGVDIRETLSRGESWSGEFIVQGRDGSPFPVFVTNTPLIDVEGKVESIIGVSLDVSERRQAEEKLRESESLLAASQRITHLGSWIMDISESGTVVENSERWSDEHYRIFGFEPGEVQVTDEFFYNSVHPEDREPLAKMLRETIERQQPYDIEHRIILPNGTERIVHAMAEVVVDVDTGKPLKLLGSVQDITERRLGERALRESDEKFHQLADNINESFWIRSPDLNQIYYISPAFEQIWGRSLKDVHLSADQWLSFILPEDREFVREAYERLMGSAPKIDIEYRIVRGDDEVRWVRTRGFQVRNEGGELIRLAGIVSDITERKKAVQALAESEERYRDLVENAIDVIYTLDLKGNYTSMNKAGELLSGYPHDVSMTRNIADSLLPEYREKARQMISAQIHGQDVSAFEIEIENKDGRRIALEVNTRAIKENGVTVGVQGIARDVTERKRAEAEIKEKSALLEAQLNASIDGILIVDGQGKKVLHNKQFVDLFKLPQHVINDPDDDAQVQWVTGSIKDPDKFVEKVRYLYANPYEISRDELELKDGTTLDRYSAPVLGLDNKNYGRIWTFRDITARKVAEVTLRESELRLRTIIDTEPECVKLLARDGSLLEMNAAGLQMIEAESFEQVANSNVAGIVVEQDRKAFRDFIRKVFTGESAVLEFQIRGLKGTHRWLDTHASPLRDASGNITALLGITRDITKQKRSEKERRILFEIIQGAITSHGLDGFLELTHRLLGQMVYAENFQVTLHDPATDHFVTKFWADKFDPLPPPRPVDMGFGSYVLRTAEPLMVTAEVKQEMVARGDAVLSGTPSSSWVGVPLRTPTRTVGVMVLQHYEVENAYGPRDLEFLASVGDQIALAIERQWAHDLLLESQDRLTLAAESVNLGIWDWDVHENKLNWDSRMCELYGIDENEFIGAYEAWQTGLHPNDRERCDANIQAALVGERPFSNDFRVLWPNGELHYIEARAVVERDENGKPLRMVGVNWDITERKLAEEALEAAEANYRSIFENAVEGIFQSTVDGAFLSANPAMARILGFDSPEELIALRTDIDNQHYVDTESRIKLAKFLATQGVAAAFECEVYRKDKTRIWTQENIRAIYGNDDKISHFEGSMEDITERKLLEEQLRQSQKMEAIGVLAGGIAHDFNNLLTAINGYSDLTLRKMSPDDPLRRNIEEVKKAGDRAAELTSQLLAFSRKQVLNPIVHNLNTVIGNIENMLRRIIRENIELRTVLDADLGNVKADPGQIEQVIMNLVVNARDAMPDGGRLTIKTQNVHLDEVYVSQKVAIAPGPFVRLTISDTGEGMTAEIQRHIFEPFFTTKGPGKGTGLGLSMVYGIVQQSGGDILVYSEPGHGTSFKLYLPRVDNAVERTPSLDVQKKTVGTETILLVEDEEAVRGFATEVLETSGYTVLAASNGPEALDLCQGYGKPIHLLVSDVIMPKMGGVELRKRVIEILPRIKVLFISGYTDDAIGDLGINDAKLAFLEKPFSPDYLVQKVRELMDVL